MTKYLSRSYKATYITTYILKFNYIYIFRISKYLFYFGNYILEIKNYKIQTFLHKKHSGFHLLKNKIVQVLLP